MSRHRTTVTFNSAIIENGFTCCNPTNSQESLSRSPTPNLSVSQPILKNQVTVLLKWSMDSTLALDWVLGLTGARYYVGLEKLKYRRPDWALSMANKPSKEHHSSGRLWIHHYHLPTKLTWVLRTHRVAWERSKGGLRMQVSI